MKILNVKALLLGIIINTFPVIAMEVQQKIRLRPGALIKNRDKIIKFGNTALALLGTTYEGVNAASKLRVIETFKNNNVAMPEDEAMKITLYSLGFLAAEKGMAGIQKLTYAEGGYTELAMLLLAYPNFDKALAELTGVPIDW